MKRRSLFKSIASICAANVLIKLQAVADVIGIEQISETVRDVMYVINPEYIAAKFERYLFSGHLFGISEVPADISKRPENSIVGLPLRYNSIEDFKNKISIPPFIENTFYGKQEDI